ncbi:Na+/proline symporter [Bacillus sp. SORGH_AS 510]|nr:Na+/proline symporter [Bacillus sp. SORGH_AS_0510]
MLLYVFLIGILIWFMFITIKILKISKDVETVKEYLKRNEDKVYQVLKKVNE